MKNKVKPLIILPLIFSFLTACNQTSEKSFSAVEDEKVYKLNYTDITVALGSSFQLILSLNGLEVAATWSASNHNVTVNDGLVTGNEVGEAVVTASVDDLCFDCHVDVLLPENLPELVINSNNPLILEVADSFIIVPSLLYEGEKMSVDNIDFELDGSVIEVAINDDFSLDIGALFVGTAELIIKTTWHNITLYKELIVEVK